jgi:ERCC4-related helicase
VTNGDTQVRLACLEDDAQGDRLEVFWEREIDALVLEGASWDAVAHRGFDQPRHFSAYLHALRWNCVTSTNPKLFQAPYRAGIEVKAYQLEPLRKALQMPRVSLFIADDVGLGKTIEAGLILRELILRQKIRRVLISCPPSVVSQWQEEMEQRFGLTFVVVDREFLAAKRRERGYGVNPWHTHTRFIISHALLRDEVYAAPLRDWLGGFCASSLLIFDEAHNAAPASGARYAIDSQLTRTLRDLAPRFEHKLFLSATPHNGHSNSFAALLEILDPQRFCRGVPVRSQKLLDAVMVRRLKQDLRELNPGDFPERQIIPILIQGLSTDAPELRLAQLLQQYRAAREQRLKTAPKSTQKAALLVLTNLQKRLLSSIEAFARTLKVHRESLSRQEMAAAAGVDFSLLVQPPGADDERAELDEQEVQSEELSQMARATQVSAQGVSPKELALLTQMQEIAETARRQADSKVTYLLEWIRQQLCPNLGQPGATWLNRRVLIFTEYADTKRYLEQQLGNLVSLSDQGEARIATFHGGSDLNKERRKWVQEAFNTEPTQHPLRILIATDAAREGVNLQNHCADLFHFDIPWNPSRLEQRNGRIDRKLQRAPEVRCHYFVLQQRAEDRVLDVLMQKVKAIHTELGCMSPVLAKNVEQLLADGIPMGQSEELLTALQESKRPHPLELQRQQAIDKELEVMRQRQEQLGQQQTELEMMLRESKLWLGLDNEHFRETLSVSLELLGAQSLAPVDAAAAVADLERSPWVLPALDQQAGADSTWANTLDTLRRPRPKGMSLWDWRKQSQIRPVVFQDPGCLDGTVVHLHLEHRVVQRLLGRFLSQGFLHDELSRACICRTEDPIPRVLILGRLSLYGQGATRLHDEIISVAAEWIEPDARGRGRLRPLGEGDRKDVMQLLEDSLAQPRLREVPPALAEKLKSCAARDVEDLRAHLERRAQELRQRAERKLEQRGEREAKSMKALLEEQRQRILEQVQQHNQEAQQLALQFNLEEVRQLEADQRHWQKRVDELAGEIMTEPERIQTTYHVKAERVEPVGIIYLWPVSN